MTDIDVPDWVVDSVLDSLFPGNSGYVIPNYRDPMKAVLRAALSAWVVPVGRVCMNGRRYGHGLFADIEVQYPTTTTPGPKIGSELYVLRPEKPE